MQSFVEYLVKNLVDQPDAVSVKCLDSQKMTIIEVSVAKEDIGKVIGKNGHTIQALRTITSVTGSRLGRQIRLALID